MELILLEKWQEICFFGQPDSSLTAESTEDQNKAIVPYKPNPSLLLLQSLVNFEAQPLDKSDSVTMVDSCSSVIESSSLISMRRALPPLPTKKKRVRKLSPLVDAELRRSP